MTKQSPLRGKINLAIAAPPICFRVPKPGCVDPHFGFTRPFWYQLIMPNRANNFIPPVKSRLLKKLNAKRGIRLIDFSSAKAWLERQGNEDQNGPSIGLAS